MLSCIFVYFSQTGATKRVAEAISRGLEQSGYRVVLSDLTRNPPDDLSQYDLVGVGTPVFYYRPPFHVTDYLRGVNGCSGKRAFVFATHGTYPGHTCGELAEILRHKGCTDVSTFHSLGAGYFLGYQRQGVQFAPGHPSGDDMDEAERFGTMVAHGEIQSLTGQSLKLVYRLERFLTNKWFTRHIYSRSFRTNKQKCNGCGLCVRNCPTGNIRREGGTPRFGRNCLLCLLCEANCPKQAIVSPLSWPVFLPFLRYNVNRGKKDPMLTHCGWPPQEDANIQSGG